MLKIIQVADENVTTFSTSQVKEKNKQTILIIESFLGFKMHCEATNVFYSAGYRPPSAPEVLQASVPCLRRGEHVSFGKQPAATSPVQQ